MVKRALIGTPPAALRLGQGRESRSGPATEMSKKVQQRRKVGWQNDRDIENLIRNDIDDFFFEELRGRRGVMLDPSLLDGIVDEMLGTARTRLAL
jgi:type I restriction enzyme R subunit